MKQIKKNSNNHSFISKGMIYDYEYNPFEDPIYISQMQSIMSENLEKGNSVLNMANGDLKVTETKQHNMIYIWDKAEQKFVKTVMNKSNADKELYMISDISEDDSSPIESNGDEMDYNPFSNPIYIAQMQKIMSDQIEKGNNVLSMSNGDLIVTDIKTLDVHYQWNENTKKLSKNCNSVK